MLSSVLFHQLLKKLLLFFMTLAASKLLAALLVSCWALTTAEISCLTQLSPIIFSGRSADDNALTIWTSLPVKLLIKLPFLKKVIQHGLSIVEVLNHLFCLSHLSLCICYDFSQAKPGSLRGHASNGKRLTYSLVTLDRFSIFGDGCQRGFCLSNHIAGKFLGELCVGCNRIQQLLVIRVTVALEEIIQLVCQESGQQTRHDTNQHSGDCISYRNEKRQGL